MGLKKTIKKYFSIHNFNTHETVEIAKKHLIYGVEF